MRTKLSILAVVTLLVVMAGSANAALTQSFEASEFTVTGGVNKIN